MEILQPFLRKPWENYFNMCFHLLLFVFFPSCISFFLWPGTNFYMLTSLTSQEKSHLIVRFSPQSGRYHFQFNSFLLTVLLCADLERGCLAEWCLGEVPRGLCGTGVREVLLGRRLLPCLSPFGGGGKAGGLGVLWWELRASLQHLGEFNAASPWRQTGLCCSELGCAG